MAHFARLIMFDRRGTGLSDPVSEPPTLEQQADDLTAVLNAAGSEQVSIIGGSDLGLGPVCRHLSRAGDGAGAQRSGGGWRTHARRTQPEAVLDAIENDWGNGTLVSVFAPATPTI